MQCVLQNCITLIFHPPATLQSAFLVVRLYIIRCFSSDPSWGLPAKKWICCFFLIRETPLNSLEYNRHRLAETFKCNCNTMFGQNHRHNVTMDNSFSTRQEMGFWILINMVQNSLVLSSVINKPDSFTKLNSTLC